MNFSKKQLYTALSKFVEYLDYDLWKDIYLYEDRGDELLEEFISFLKTGKL